MAGLAFLVDALAFVIVVLWAYGEEAARGGRRRGLLDMIGEATASAARSAPRWAPKLHAMRSPWDKPPGWRRSVGRR